MTVAATISYDPLAIASDAGFPQAFSQIVADRSYRFVLYVNVAEEVLEPLADETLLELPADRAFLVLRVDREAESEQPVRLFQRKVVPAHAYTAFELAFSFDEMVVAKRNLNGTGAFGSSVKGGVTSRWPSSSGTA